MIPLVFAFHAFHSQRQWDRLAASSDFSRQGGKAQLSRLVERGFSSRRDEDATSLTGWETGRGESSDFLAKSSDCCRIRVGKETGRDVMRLRYAERWPTGSPLNADHPNYSAPAEACAWTARELRIINSDFETDLETRRLVVSEYYR